MVELVAVISLTGVLLAAFVPTFVRHVRLSKIAEATEQLESLYRGTAAYYSREQAVGKRLLRGCLPESVGPFPAQPSPEPRSADFAAADTPQRETWLALGQSEAKSLRYSYEVVVAQPGCEPRRAHAGAAVIVRALGDLDGDGVLSTLERETVIAPDRRSLLPHGPLHIRQRVE